MNKKKELDELYDEIYSDIAIQFGAGDYIEDEDRESLARQIVEHLKELDYRKADEVRKETIEEIFRELFCTVKEVGDFIITTSAIIERAQMYGITIEEVDE